MPFTNQYRKVIVAVLVIAAVGILIFFAARRPFTISQNQNSGLPSRESSSSPQTPISGLAPAYRGEPVADIAADPILLKQMPPETDRKFRAELATIAGQLATNPAQPELWSRVAYIKHYYDDDTGARDAYEYLNSIAPENAVAFYNLALIYGYNLKEPEKAKAKFELALRLNPLDVSFYIGFADFYREVMRDLPAAERTLLLGTSKVASSDLYTSLGSLYTEMGNKAQAILWYEKALSRSDLGDAERQAVANEIARLKQ